MSPAPFFRYTDEFMKTWKKIVLAALAVILAAGLYVFIEIHSLRTEQVTPDVHVIFGVGGNVGVLNTDEGAVIVDTMTLKYQGNRIRKLAEELTGQPVVAIINSHYHLDHTHGNPAFDAGMRIISTGRTLHHIKTVDSDYFSGGAAELMPNELLDQRQRIVIGNKTIELLPTAPAHTDGDLAALFVEDGVVHTGDLFFNRLYPNIDLEGGGSVAQWSAAIEQILQLPFERIIPGHGEVGGRQDLLQFQRFIRQLANVGRKAAAQGWTRKQTERSGELTEDEGYGDVKLLIFTLLDREFVLGRAWDEATGNFEVRD